jgi:hypothetical protein
MTFPILAWSSFSPSNSREQSRSDKTTFLMLSWPLLSFLQLTIMLSGFKSRTDMLVRLSNGVVFYFITPNLSVSNF